MIDLLTESKTKGTWDVDPHKQLLVVVDTSSLNTHIKIISQNQLALQNKRDNLIKDQSIFSLWWSFYQLDHNFFSW